MADEQRARLTRTRDKFHLAAYDMRLVRHAAEHLAEAKLHADVRRVLETGTIVAYARPFMSGALGGLDRRKYSPKDDPDMAALHNDLLRLRNVYAAHTDETDMRAIVEVGELVGRPGSVQAEQFRPIVAEQWVRVVELARVQAEAMRAAAEEANAKLLALD